FYYLGTPKFPAQRSPMINRCAAVLFAAFLFAPMFATSSPAQTKAKTPKQAGAEDVLQLHDGWALQSSCKVDKSGEVISTANYAPTGWYSVTVPTTVVAALVKNKVYADPDYGMNLRNYPGMNYPFGANFSNIPMRQDSPFMVPWWYRKTFTLPESYKGKTIWLDFGGINYRANIFL